MRRIEHLVILITSLSLLPFHAKGAGEAWPKYENERFGFVLTYPKGLVASKDPENGAGNEFHSADGEFSVSAQGHYLRKDEGDSLEKRWTDELKELGDTVTYKKKSESWYVISGVSKKGLELYRKFYIKGSNWVSFEITYPHAKNKQYDPWVARIEKSFVAFREGDFDTLE